MRLASSRDGFALIGVLWIMVLIALIGLDFSLRAGDLTRRTLNVRDRSIARAAAEGGVSHADARLVEMLRRSQVSGSSGAPRIVDPWMDAGALMGDTLEIGDALAVVHLVDAGAKLHLNSATESELRRLMTALRIDDGDADRAAQAMLDWRDLDDLRRGRGAEDEEYVQADAPVLPANGPFGSVDELQLVLGISPEMFERLAPFLTVRGSGRINLSAAPSEVIASLDGVSTALLALILRARTTREGVPDLLTLTDQLDEDAREQFRAHLPRLLSRVTTQTQELVVVSEAWVPGTSMYVIAEAVAVRAQEALFITDRAIR